MAVDKIAYVNSVGFFIMDGSWSRAPPMMGVYQCRAGLNRYRTFGDVRETEKAAMAALKSRFFPQQSDEELMSRIELISWATHR
jgi:hypothetical protein